MTLDEAIKHSLDVAESQDNLAMDCRFQVDAAGVKACRKCAEEHRQLARWLQDYKRLLAKEVKI